jgi:hypothetical protein
MRASKRYCEAIRVYVESQAHEKAVHLEKSASGIHAPLARRTRWDETRVVPSWRARILTGAVSP